MRQALAHLIEFSGISRREVERRLCQRHCGTDLGRLLSGRLALLVVAGIGTALVLTGGNLYLAHTVAQVKAWRRTLRGLSAILMNSTGSSSITRQRARTCFIFRSATFRVDRPLLS
jgi:hypothetical protein